MDTPRLDVGLVVALAASLLFWALLLWGASRLLQG
jgi:hypothetical protein